MRKDGGWAARTWELWLLVSEVDAATGAWRVCWPAFTALVPRTILDDDDARMELAEAFLSVCAATLNNPKDRLMPDGDDD